MLFPAKSQWFLTILRKKSKSFSRTYKTLTWNQLTLLISSLRTLSQLLSYEHNSFWQSQEQTWHILPNSKPLHLLFTLSPATWQSWPLASCKSCWINDLSILSYLMSNLYAMLSLAFKPPWLFHFCNSDLQGQRWSHFSSNWNPCPGFVLVYYWWSVNNMQSLSHNFSNLILATFSVIYTH